MLPVYDAFTGRVFEISLLSALPCQNHSLPISVFFPFPFFPLIALLCENPSLLLSLLFTSPSIFLIIFYHFKKLKTCPSPMPLSNFPVLSFYIYTWTTSKPFHSLTLSLHLLILSPHTCTTSEPLPSAIHSLYFLILSFFATSYIYHVRTLPFRYPFSSLSHPFFSYIYHARTLPYPISSLKFLIRSSDTYTTSEPFPSPVLLFTFSSFLLIPLPRQKPYPFLSPSSSLPRPFFSYFYCI